MKTTEQIENILFKRFNTSFSVSKDMYGYIVLPNDTNKLARELEVDVDSEEYHKDLEKIEQAVNLLFNLFSDTEKNQTEEEPQRLAIYWSVQDFETLAIQNFEELKRYHPEEFKNYETWEQLYDKTKFTKALKKMIDKHDCEVGITWLTLEHYLIECRN